VPNWCMNQLTVRGERSRLDAFAARVRGVDEDGDVSALCFSALLPTPPRLFGGAYSQTAECRRLQTAFAAAAPAQQRELLESHPGFALYLATRVLELELNREERNGWYYWRLDHWGAKAECVCPQEPRRRPDSLIYVFDTAWSPPSPFVAACSRRFRDLVFELAYHEPGNCFVGWEQHRSGRLLAERSAGEAEAGADLLEDAGLEQEAEAWRSWLDEPS
jgi:hypothetical protein